MPEWKIMSDDLFPHPYFQYVLGGWQHPETGLWQLWVTFDGENINWVAAYQNEDRIQEAKEKARQFISAGEQWNRQKAFALLNSLYEEREAEPQPMPSLLESMIRLNFTWR
jgi:hypothetical protein